MPTIQEHKSNILQSSATVIIIEYLLNQDQTSKLSKQSRYMAIDIKNFKFLSFSKSYCVSINFHTVNTKVIQKTKLLFHILFCTY
jgi:hypothetical protein